MPTFNCSVAKNHWDLGIPTVIQSPPVPQKNLQLTYEKNCTINPNFTPLIQSLMHQLCTVHHISCYLSVRPHDNSCQIHIIPTDVLYQVSRYGTFQKKLLVGFSIVQATPHA